MNVFRAIAFKVTHTDRVFGSFIQSLDLAEESSQELNTLHTAANNPDKESMESEGIAYNPTDIGVVGMSQGYKPITTKVGLRYSVFKKTEDRIIIQKKTKKSKASKPKIKPNIIQKKRRPKFSKKSKDNFFLRRLRRRFLFCFRIMFVAIIDTI